MTTTITGQMTAEEFFDWANRPENAERSWELERGRVIEVPSPGKFHGFVCGNVARIVGNYAMQRGQGYVCSNDSGLLVERSPDTVRGPDICYYIDEQTAETMDRKFAIVPPVLVVEVRSPSDSLKRMQRRLAEYLKLGVAMVWLVYPEERLVTVNQLHEIPRPLDDEDELTGNSVLPEFRCRVAEFFAVPGKGPNPREEKP
jgi:Uma2 family endonuclease